MMYDLAAMPLDDLKSLKKSVNDAILAIERREKRAVNALHAVARRHGYDLADLLRSPLLTASLENGAQSEADDPDDDAAKWTIMVTALFEAQKDS